MSDPMGILAPVLELTGLAGGLSATIAWVRLSKIYAYLVDNELCNRLSDVGHAVNFFFFWPGASH